MIAADRPARRLLQNASVQVSAILVNARRGDLKELIWTGVIRNRVSPKRGAVNGSEGKLGSVMTLVFMTIPYLFLRQHWDDYSQGSSFTLGDAFMCLAALQMLIHRRRIASARVSFTLLLIGALFVVLCFVSGAEGFLLYGVDVSLPALLSGTVQYAFILLILPLIGAHYLTSGNLRSALRYISFSYLFPMILVLLCLPHSTPERLRAVFFFNNRALGSYGNPNTFAAIIGMTFFLYLYLAITDEGRWRIVGQVGILLCLLCTFLSVSFSGALIMLCVIIANLTLCFFWSRHPFRRHRGRLAVLAVSTLLFTIVVSSAGVARWPWILEDVLVRLSAVQTSNVSRLQVRQIGSAEDRLQLMQLGLDLIAERHGGILAGHGMKQTEQLRQFSFAGVSQTVHQVYLLLWVEGGLVLLLVFGCYLIQMFRNVWALARAFPDEGVAVGSALLGLVVFGMFNPHIYMRFFWIPALPAFIDWRAHTRKSQNRWVVARDRLVTGWAIQ